MNKYEVLNMVGEGAYGVVLRCRNKTTGDTVAIKKFKESDEDESIRKTTLREVKILRMLRHRNIVSLIEAFRRKGKLYLVFEYVDKNLLQVLEEQPDGLDSEIVRSYIYQLTLAIQWCHKHTVVHRDIKPENLLVNLKNNTLKLCDFGFARILENSCDLTDYVATRWYRAPELLLGSTTYTFAVDVWAIGCIMGEITDGQPVFAGDSEVDQLYIIQKVLGPLTPEQMEAFEQNPRFNGLKFPEVRRPETVQKKYVGRLGKRAMQMLTLILHMSPSQRPSADALLSHAYFESLAPTPTAAAAVSVIASSKVKIKSESGGLGLAYEDDHQQDKKESKDEHSNSKDDVEEHRSKSIERALERERELLREREIKALREFSVGLPIKKEGGAIGGGRGLHLEQLEGGRNIEGGRHLVVPPLDRQRSRPMPTQLGSDGSSLWPSFEEDTQQGGHKTPMTTLESLLSCPLPLIASSELLRADSKPSNQRSSSKQSRGGGTRAVVEDKTGRLKVSQVAPLPRHRA